MARCWKPLTCANNCKDQQHRVRDCSVFTHLFQVDSSCRRRNSLDKDLFAFWKDLYASGIIVTKLIAKRAVQCFIVLRIGTQSRGFAGCL